MHVLCHIDDIAEGCSREFQLGEHALFAVKKDAVVYVYKNHCPHLGTELNWQEDQFLDPDGALIQCSTHGALFLIEDGSCISGPCMGAQLTAITSRIDQNQVLIAMPTEQQSR